MIYEKNDTFDPRNFFFTDHLNRSGGDGRYNTIMQKQNGTKERLSVV